MAEPAYHEYQEYSATLNLVAQQKTNVLRQAVRVEPVGAERKAFTRTGVLKARREDTRFADTKLQDPRYMRRWVTPKAWRIAVPCDDFDQARQLSDPTSPLSQACGAALAREQMANIVSGALGTAYGGEDGLDTFDLPANNTIAHGSVGLTLGKVQAALEKLKLGHGVEPDAMLYLAWTSKQETEFLANAEVKSIDYNTQRVLVQGGMGQNQFLGFRYITLNDWTDDEGNQYNILPKSGTTRSLIAWIQNGVIFGENQAIQVRVGERPDKNYLMQVWAKAHFGSVREQDTHVIEIEVTES